MPAKIFACSIAMPLLAALCCSSAWGAEQSGKVSVKLNFVRAVQPNGSPDPAHDKDCTQQLSQPTSRYVGMPVTTSYSIDPKTLIESATSNFPSPNSTKPIELSAKLAPLGIAGVYAFGAFRPPALPESYVLFQVGLDFKNPVSTFLVLNQSSVGYNCSISSSKSAPAVSDFASPPSK
jgi:hypothetical protein